MRKLILALPFVFAFAFACNKGKETARGAAKAEPATAEPATAEPATAEPATAEPATAEPQVIRVEGFQTPESVLHDDVADIYLVSNINGSPFGKDDNGFISRVTPDGEISELAWIDGKRENVTLNAPKGTAFLGDTLYVSDIDTVRLFDRKTGEPKGEIAIPGATFLNDLVAVKDVIYASDSGLVAGFKPSGSASIWSISEGKATIVAKGDELGTPNGLAFADDRLWVVSFRSGELFRVTPEGKREAVVKLPKGSLDGLAALADGTLSISSWEAQSVFAGKPEGPFEAIISGVQSPADIGWDAKRNRLLIPLFQKHTLEIHPLQAK